jgi:hypothetical protein
VRKATNGYIITDLYPVVGWEYVLLGVYNRSPIYIYTYIYMYVIHLHVMYNKFVSDREEP